MTNYDINQIFVKCSAHTLCGIKCANLFTVYTEYFSPEVFASWKKTVDRCGLSIAAFSVSPVLTMVFVYDLVWIRKILSDSLISAYLAGKGYADPENTEQTLEELYSRLQKKEGFPHEVGIFLGYPVEDVMNFEQYKGQHCKYCGYWKCYGNPEEAKKCCEKYNLCSQLCKQWFDEGYSVPQIIKKYKEMVKEAA